MDVSTKSTEGYARMVGGETCCTLGYSEYNSSEYLYKVVQYNCTGYLYEFTFYAVLV
jgi:hypothetical protein